MNFEYSEAPRKIENNRGIDSRDLFNAPQWFDLGRVVLLRQRLPPV